MNAPPFELIEYIKTLSEEPRPAGAPESERPLQFVRGALESRGFKVEAQRFEFERYDPRSWSLIVDGQKVDSLPAVCSATTQRGGLSAMVVREDAESVEGKMVLLRISTLHESLAVENLAERGALGVVAFQERGSHLVARAKYPTSSIPCVTVPPAMGTWLWQKAKDGPLPAQLHVLAETVKAEGTNLLTLPSGSPKVLFTAHRDSRPFSPGAVDNASGTSMLLHLADTLPKHRFALLSTDAEEYGLLGAKAFVGSSHFGRQRPPVVNVDSVGSGPLKLVEQSRGGPLSPGLATKVESLARTVGVVLWRMSTIKGSDSDEFQKEGYEASWIRSDPTPTATTVEDVASRMDGAVLKKCASVLEALASGL